MPDLDFKVAGVEPAFDGMTPVVHFLLDVENLGVETVQSVLLQVQVRVEPTLRTYTDRERERLVELFGQPELWSRSLRSMSWMQSSLTIPSFDGRTTARLAVPTTFDLSIATTKYFYGLEDGDVPLLFLFSGTVFYTNASGQLQIQRIPWDKESRFRIPVAQWQELMDAFYPNASWIYLQRDVFEKLYAYRRSGGFTSWEEVVSRLLESARAEALS